MAKFPQSQSKRDICRKAESSKQKLASSFPQLLRRTWNSGFFSLFFMTQIRFWRPQDRILPLIRCPQELSPFTSPHSNPGNLGQSLPAASLLHVNWVHGPGSLCSTEAGHGRGLGHRLQMLLGQPDVMELLELFHHAVFEVWV